MFLRGRFCPAMRANMLPILLGREQQRETFTPALPSDL